MSAGARSRALVAGALAAWLACALSPQARAGDDDLNVRIVQIKGTGTRAKGKQAEIDKDLEPLRKHLEQTSYSKYQLLDKATKKGPPAKVIAFELQNKYKAEATVSRDKEKKGGFSVTLRVTKTVKKDKEETEEEVSKSTWFLADGATALSVIGKGAGADDLIIAITASKDAL